jgi:hypothetical protein
LSLSVAHSLSRAAKPRIIPLGEARTESEHLQLEAQCSFSAPEPLEDRSHTSQHPPTDTMNSLRVARAAIKAQPALRIVQRRGYADVAPDKIRLSLALPHQVCFGRLLYGQEIGAGRKEKVG